MNAEENFWKLRTIDSFESSAPGKSSEELRKIIETLLLEEDLKEILLGCNPTSQVERSSSIAPNKSPDQKL